VSLTDTGSSLAAAARTAARYAVRRRVPARSFDSAGVRLHYTDEGAGTPVVLVHGFAVNERLNWRLPGVTPMLTARLRVISVDVRGHGRSGKPHDVGQYGMHLVHDVVRLLDHLGIGRAYVVGYSLGGFIALKLATVSPERLLGVAVLGAGWEPPTNLAFLDALPRLADALEAGKGIGPLMGNLGEDRPRPGLVHWMSVKLLTRYFNDPRALIAVIRSAPQLAVSEAELRGIDLAVCSIVGDRDPLRASVDAMRGKLANHTVTVVDGADHVSAPMRPELHARLLEFLTRDPGPGGQARMADQ